MLLVAPACSRSRAARNPARSIPPKCDVEKRIRLWNKGFPFGVKDPPSRRGDWPFGVRDLPLARLQGRAPRGFPPGAGRFARPPGGPNAIQP